MSAVAHQPPYRRPTAIIRHLLNADWSVRTRWSKQVIAGVSAADRRIGPEVAIVPLHKIALWTYPMRDAVGGVVDEELDHGLRRRVFRPMAKMNFGLEGAEVRQRAGIER